jgi:CRP/FNR family transcriptional regulator, cyclic AMP receptor protein
MTHARSPTGEPRAAESICQILREDPDLGDELAPIQRERAVEECVAPTMRLPRGHWSGDVPDKLAGGIGLLVLNGLLLRRVGVNGRFAGELLGSGDLLRPWQDEHAHPAIPRATGWRVLEPARLAVLDQGAARRIARFPELTGRLVGRALERSRNLSLGIAIIHHPKVELRLQMLLWHLADRWGHVRPDGVAIPMHLTHTQLADLIAAQRPTVTTAMSELTRRGVIVQMPHGWLLRGRPPPEVLDIRNVEANAAG